jgi:2-polyprenyl-3-methyl-5-hydroxy-6-metoxy-1,4-benzoquinol methylase
MKTAEIAPGSILQRIYLNERLRHFGDKKNFLEVGAGTGYISNLLLSKGYAGIGFDLNESSCQVNSLLNNKYILEGNYAVCNNNFFDIDKEKKYDIIISSMVIEHLNEEEINKYFLKVSDLLTENGILISLVLSSMDYWGYRR